MAAVNPYIPSGSSKSTAELFETLKSGLSHNIFFQLVIIVLAQSVKAGVASYSVINFALKSEDCYYEMHYFCEMHLLTSRQSIRALHSTHYTVHATQYTESYCEGAD